jgi:outer membrane protein assembly factor BamB
VRRLCFLVLAGSGLALGCGSKSELADWERAPGEPTPPAGTPGPNPTHPEGCIPGLAPGAASPIAGYCSDRAGRARHALPSAPSLLASLATESVFGSEPRVDAEGRAYFAIDTDDIDSAVLPKTLIAVDPDAALAWTLDFEGVIGSFAIVADNTLRVIETTSVSPIERWVSRVSRGGERLSRQRLPDDAGLSFAVSAKGNLIFTPTGNEDAGRVVATRGNGDLVWRSEPLAGYADPAAIAPDGRVIVSASRGEQASVVALDGATGALIWSFVDSGWAGPPAIAPDGSIRVPLGAPDLLSQELVALETDGSVRFRTSLPGQAVPVGEPTCVDALGRSFVKSWDALSAIDASGLVRFSREVHPNAEFSCATDSAGTLFYAGLGFTALDVESGDVIWSLSDGFPSGPGSIAFAGPVVLGGDRRLGLMDHEGAVHFLGA